MHCLALHWVLFQPEENLKEDFLFPMSTRLSYASSPESDTEMMPGGVYEDDEQPSPSPPRRKLIRSSSDPSINTGDNVPGIPPYPAPPSYHRDKVLVFLFNFGFSNSEFTICVFYISKFCTRLFISKLELHLRYVHTV